MRAVYCQLLSPLLHTSEDVAAISGSDSGSVQGPAAGAPQQAGDGSDCGSGQDAAADSALPAGDYSV